MLPIYFYKSEPSRATLSSATVIMAGETPLINGSTVDPSGNDNVQPIAVIGLAGQIPGEAVDARALWGSLLRGTLCLVRDPRGQVQCSRLSTLQSSEDGLRRSHQIIDGP